MKDGLARLERSGNPTVKHLLSELFFLLFIVVDSGSLAIFFPLTFCFKFNTHSLKKGPLGHENLFLLLRLGNCVLQ